MLEKLATNRLLWLLTAVLAGIAAGVGVIYPEIYRGVIREDMMPMVIPQDAMTLAAAVIIIVAAAVMRERAVVAQLLVISLLGYLFYEYGILAIERVYNGLYPLYLALFSLSFYTLSYAIAHIRWQALRTAAVPAALRHVAIGFALLVPLIFIPLWLGAVLQIIRSGDKPEFYYSIYILDLCFVMPAFLIVAGLAIRRHGLGILLMPALFIKGFTIIFPLGIAELVKPRYGLPPDLNGLWSSLLLAGAFLALAVVYFRQLAVDGTPPASAG